MLRIGNQIVVLNSSIAADPSEYTENPVWSGLTSYWRFDETSGTNVVDSKGSYDGTLSTTNIINSNGKNNYCSYFGTNISDNINIGTTYSFERTDNFSFSMWLNSNNNSTTVQGIIANFKSTTYIGYELLYLAQKFRFELAGSSGSRIRIGTTNTVMTDTNWHHVVLTYNGSSKASGVTMYMDGTKITAMTTYVDTLNSTTVSTVNTLIGKRQDGDTPFKNKIDEFAIYNRVLSQPEVTTLYNSGTGLFY